MAFDWTVIAGPIIKLGGSMIGGALAGPAGAAVGPMLGSILAKELGVPVLALAQLNRGVEAREEKRPTLSDLRDAGTIEEDADNVIFAFREAYYLERTKFTDPGEERLRQSDLGSKRNVFEAVIAKNRNGPCEVVTIGCNMAANAFYNAPQALRSGEF